MSLCKVTSITHDFSGLYPGMYLPLANDIDDVLGLISRVQLATSSLDGPCMSEGEEVAESVVRGYRFSSYTNT